MSLLKDNTAILNEEVWRAWVAKGKARDQVAARRMRSVAIIMIAVVAIGLGLYTILKA